MKTIPQKARAALLHDYLTAAKHYRDEARTFPPLARVMARRLMRDAALGWRRQWAAL